MHRGVKIALGMFLSVVGVALITYTLTSGTFALFSPAFWTFLVAAACAGVGAAFLFTQEAD